MPCHCRGLCNNRQCSCVRAGIQCTRLCHTNAPNHQCTGGFPFVGRAVGGAGGIVCCSVLVLLIVIYYFYPILIVVIYNIYPNISQTPDYYSYIQEKMPFLNQKRHLINNVISIIPKIHETKPRINMEGRLDTDISISPLNRSDYKFVRESIINSRLPLFIYGGTGFGKTFTVRDIVSDHRFPAVVFPLQKCSTMSDIYIQMNERFSVWRSDYDTTNFDVRAGTMRDILESAFCEYKSINKKKITLVFDDAEVLDESSLETNQFLSWLLVLWEIGCIQFFFLTSDTDYAVLAAFREVSGYHSRLEYFEFPPYPKDDIRTYLLNMDVNLTAMQINKLVDSIGSNMNKFVEVVTTITDFKKSGDSEVLNLMDTITSNFKASFIKNNSTFSDHMLAIENIFISVLDEIYFNGYVKIDSLEITERNFAKALAKKRIIYSSICDEYNYCYRFTDSDYNEIYKQWNITYLKKDCY